MLTCKALPEAPIPAAPCTRQVPAALHSGRGTGTATPAGGLGLVPAGIASGAGLALQPLLGLAHTATEGGGGRAGPAAPARRTGRGAVEAARPLPQPFNGGAAPSARGPARGFRLPPPQEPREGHGEHARPRRWGAASRRWPPPKRRTSQLEALGTGLPDPRCPLALTSAHPAPRTAPAPARCPSAAGAGRAPALSSAYPEGGGAAAGRVQPSMPAAKGAQGGRKPGTRPHGRGSPPHLLGAG